MPSVAELPGVIARALRMAKHFAPLILAIAASLACGPAEPRRAHLRVAAAASLRPALEEIAAAYETSHPDLDVLINAAASGTLRRQIEFGDAADLFISANERHMDALVEAGRVVAGDVEILCGNRLVVGTPGGDQIPPEALRDAARFGRIGIANPRTAPLGEFARQALDSLDLWPAVESRLIFAENATQLANYLRLGAVDAAIVYATDWQNLGFALDPPRAVDASLHAPIRYPMAPVQGTAIPGQARRFLRHLTGEAAQRTLRAHGFTPATSADTSRERSQDQ